MAPKNKQLSLGQFKGHMKEKFLENKKYGKIKNDKMDQKTNQTSRYY